MNFDEILKWARDLVAFTALWFALIAGFVRWYIGDRTGGMKDLAAYLAAALVVAWGASLYLSGETGLQARRADFFTLLLAFIARDILISLAAFGMQLRTDPIGLVSRVREALRGGPKIE